MFVAFLQAIKYARHVHKITAISLITSGTVNTARSPMPTPVCRSTTAILGALGGELAQIVLISPSLRLINACLAMKSFGIAINAAQHSVIHALITFT